MKTGGATTPQSVKEVRVKKWYAVLREQYDGADQVNLVFLFHLKDLLKAYRLHRAGRLAEAQEALEEAAAGVYVDDPLYWKLWERFGKRCEGVLEGSPEKAGAETEPDSFWAEFPVSSKPGVFRFYVSFKWWTPAGSDIACKELVLDLEEVSAPAPRR